MHEVCNSVYKQLTVKKICSQFGIWTNN